MSALGRHAQEYLRLRHGLGHDLGDAVRLLPRFVAYLDSIGAPTITIQHALTWAQRPDADPVSTVWARRMTVARGFARHMSGIDPATQIPPLGLVTYRPRRRPPFIYSTTDVQALMAAVPTIIPTELRAATFQTMIGLLAATGMRVGEAIRLERSDIDWADGVLVIRRSKFNKSREVPVDSTTITALDSYASIRNRRVLRPSSSTFFTTQKGTAVTYTDLGMKFREFVTESGVGAGSSTRPRIHDLRHTFAVQTLVRWYQNGDDVAALLPRLSTYLGHLEPASTYWYLSAAPELLALAAARLESAARERQ